MSTEVVFQTLAAIIAAGGVFALKRAWSKPSPQRPWLIAGGWAALALAVCIVVPTLGPVRGPSVAITLICAIGLTAAVANYEIRKGKVRPEREVALEPSDRRRVIWRGWLRGFLAGPMAGIAAMGVGLFVAVCFSGAAQTRMVIGGLLVPFLWAGGMAWTLSDDKILRAFAVLFGVALVSLSAAFLKGTMG
ncbi:MAG: hypothetical protein QM645_00570 [Asticcacaulis sp.]